MGGCVDLEYRVYVRFEDNPAIARKNADEKPDSKYGPFVMDAVAGADPGEEEQILYEALEESRINGKYVALYRGEPSGYDRRGRELFVPMGLAWCKDSEELAQMLGVSVPNPPPGAIPRDETMLGQPEDVSRYRPTGSGRTSQPAYAANRTAQNPAEAEDEVYYREQRQPASSRKAKTPREKFADRTGGSSSNWLVWAGIFVACFVGAFVVVYGIAMLFGR